MHKSSGRKTPRSQKIQIIKVHAPEILLPVTNKTNHGTRQPQDLWRSPAITGATCLRIQSLTLSKLHSFVISADQLLETSQDHSIHRGTSNNVVPFPAVARRRT